MTLKNWIKIGGRLLFLATIPPSVTTATMCAQPITKEQKIVFERSIDSPTRWFTTDALGQVYLLNKQQEVVKWTITEGIKARFALKKWGEVTYLDATNPFFVLVYFADFQNIILLDRNLNSLNSFSLFDSDCIAPSAVGISAQNDIWVFDAASAELKKLSQLNQTFQLNQTLTMPLLRGVKISQLAIVNNQIFLLSPEQGIFIFDIFGKLIHKIEISEICYFQVLDNQLIYKTQTSDLFSFHLVNLLTKQIELPAILQKHELLRIERGYIFALQNEIINIYDF